MSKIRLVSNGLVDVDYTGIRITNSGSVQGSAEDSTPVITGMLFKNPEITEGIVLDVVKVNEVNEDWQLEAGHFLSTDTTGMLPQIIHPRPTAETSSDAYCNNAYTGRKWQIPVTVQGGSYPFKYELITSPTGMTIGETLILGTPETGGTPQYDDGTHGTITWETPTAGEHSISVKVTDQDGNTATVNFTLTVGTDMFVFVDAVSGNDTTGDGSLVNPYKTFNTGIYLNQNGAGKICEFLAGTYLINDGTDLSVTNKALLDSTLYPRTYICIDGTATLDMSTGWFIVEETDDFYISGFTMDGSLDTDNNVRHVMLIDDSHRITVFNNTITNAGPGANPNSNPAFVCANGIGSGLTHQYVSVVRNTSAASTTLPLFTTYASTDYVVSNNITHQTRCGWSGQTDNIWIKTKDNSINGSVRANTGVGFTDNDDTTPIQIGNQSTYGVINTNVEFVWNVLYNSDTVNSTAQKLSYNGGPAGSAVNFHFSRNTMVTEGGVAIAVLEPANSVPFLVMENVCYGPSGHGDTSTDAMTVVDPLVVNPPTNASPDVDVNGNLVGTARDTYLGTRGHEVA